MVIVARLVIRLLRTRPVKLFVYKDKFTKLRWDENLFVNRCRVTSFVKNFNSERSPSS
ncbi:uncharacterized protein G2W53_042243 [Senna tora]|uniref:Uncharacterized protein n=1 Tax=Senna tora TaxID=362788 RepID=A0A834SLB5_9FABA|nr:uncharacterized protein G2W53_042243 [Senna tora]